MPSFIIALLVSALVSLPALAQTTGTAADHEALRKLKDQALQAVNTRDYALARKLINEPFMATLITQDSFTDFDKLKAYFEGLYTRDFLRMKSVTLAAEPDDYSQILQGEFALTKGATKERYELADGRVFDMAGRWTAVSLKQSGEWKLLAFHSGTNFLDNPVLSAVEKSVLWVGAAAGALGLVIGLAGGWLLRWRWARR
jgi:ketosteroid isomerase-like protein